MACRGVRRAARAWLALSAMLAAGVGGCASSSPEPARLAGRVVSDGEADAVFEAARDVLIEEFGRVTSDRRGRTLRTETVEYQPVASDRGALGRDLLRPTRMRRSAYCSVTPRDRGAMVRLRVDVEQQRVRSQQSLRPDTARQSDNPGYYTAIEQDAATTPSQTSDWEFVRRDAQLETALLNRIQDQFAPLEPDRAGAPAESSPASSPVDAGERTPPG